MKNVPKMSASVIIPVYNEEAILAGCLDALSMQTYQPAAIYIVDNNSTDASVAIAKKYPRVKVVIETTQGICIAAKTGLDAAVGNGGILLRCDADCQPTPDWIEKTVSAFNQNPSASAVTGPGVAYDTNSFASKLITLFYMKPYFFLVGLALGQKPVFGSNFSIRADTWKQISNKTHLATHQNIHDDIDISYHLPQGGKIFYDDTLRMPMSARPFRKPSSLPKRYTAGFRSIFIHWPERAPWNR